MARAKSEAASPPPAHASPLAAALVALLALAASADVLHIGFFADDFHFLDIARRVPLLRALGGAYGVYPWYRPLSREVYFALIERCGAAAPLAAHALSLLCLAGIAWLLFDLSRRLAGAAAAALAPALFVTYEYTRFLTAWASGFQDLLALLLVLLALLDHVRARRGRAAVWIALAPLAKETGFVALPLVLLYAWLIENERRPRRWMIAPALAALAAAALHVLARLTWHGGGSSAAIHVSASDLSAAMFAMIGGFVGRAPVLTPPTIALAALAGVLAFSLMWRWRGADAIAPPPRVVWFVSLAFVIGLAPLLGGVALRATLANPYYAFPAIPWACLLAALLLAAAPAGIRRAAALGIPALVAWNVLALGYQPPSPLEDSAWTFHRWDWREAERLNVISARLDADLRRALPVTPESLVVLYGGLPSGSFYQTEDGPATRLALNDPTVRAYYINGPPLLVERHRLAVLMFDPLRKLLGPGGMPPSERIRSAATAVFRGQAGTAWAYASWADSSDYDHPDRAYARAAARLLSGGASSYRAALAEGRMADSLGERPAALAAWEFPTDAPLRSAYEDVLRSPLVAERHAALADLLLARGYAVAGGFELRLAVTLDPARRADSAKLQALIEAADRGAIPVPGAPAP